MSDRQCPVQVRQMYLIDLPKQPWKLGYARIYFGICRHFSILLCNPHRSVMFSWHNVFGELSYTNMYLVIIRVCKYFRCSWQKFCCQYSICISSWRRWSRWLARLLKFRLLWQDMQHHGFQIRVAGNFIKKSHLCLSDSGSGCNVQDMAPKSSSAQFS